MVGSTLVCRRNRELGDCDIRRLFIFLRVWLVRQTQIAAPLIKFLPLETDPARTRLQRVLGFR
jgi:hypothetical protein